MDRESKSIFAWLAGLFIAVTGSLFTLLLAGNLFFLNRLVMKLDETAAVTATLSRDLMLLKIDVDTIKKVQQMKGN